MRPAVPTISSNRPVRPKKPNTNDIVDNDKNARGPSASASPNPSPPSASPAKETTATTEYRPPHRKDREPSYPHHRPAQPYSDSLRGSPRVRSGAMSDTTETVVINHSEFPLPPQVREWPGIRVVECPRRRDPSRHRRRGRVDPHRRWPQPRRPAGRSPRWVHTVGTGVDSFPFDALQGQNSPAHAASAAN